MNGKIRFGSVCSGIEAASVAWHPLGWEAAWLSEIEPFPCAVLKHHYPQVPNLGDMTLLPNRIASGEVEAPDVFCGGTPCQAFSVAGLRQSLDDSRGNLSLIFCEIANAIDNIRLIQQSSPAIIFWENVPGVLNTKDNAFGCFLAGLAGESDALIPSGGRWTDAGFIDGPKRAVAWRVLDAQYFGLAQRRKRVFVVASARDDFDPAEVLFEFDGVRRDIAPSRETRKEVATDAIPSIANCLETTCNDYSRADGFNMICTDITGPLTARDYKGISSDDCNPTMMKLIAYENHPADSRVKEMGETCTTVTSRWGTGGGNVPLVQKAYSIREDAKANTFSATELDVANSIGALQPSPQSHHAQVFVAHAFKVRGGCEGGGKGYLGKDEQVFTISTHQDQHIVAGFLPTQGSKAQGIGWAEEQAPTLRAGCDSYGLHSNMAVRRLTPKECERLQGFPDGYTDIRPKGKDTPDGSRYKALGNSWAVPVVAWIGKRINNAIT